MPVNFDRIRLMGGDGRSSGRVEVYYSYNWWTICQDGWTDWDSDVLCRQLGYYRAHSLPLHFSFPGETATETVGYY